MDTRSISWSKLKRYSGLWVAIAGEEILTSGKSLEEVMKKVEASGKKAEVFQVPLEEEVYILVFNLLGRAGIFDRSRICFDGLEKKLYLYEKA